MKIPPMIKYRTVSFSDIAVNYTTATSQNQSVQPGQLIICYPMLLCTVIIGTHAITQEFRDPAV